MASTLASLVVKIGADVTGVTAGLNTLEKRTRNLKKEFSTVKDSTLTWQGALGVLAGATGLALAANKVFELGAAVGETSSKFNTVFGPATAGAQKFLDEFANTAGLTNQKGQELLATTGAMAQGMGFTQDASAGLAEQVVRLAGDFASFNNIPIADTARAVQSALTGERESLKQLDIVINQTEVDQRALMNSGKETTSQLTAQEKATATLELITQKAGVAVGDLGRTMDSPANRARELTAQFLDFRDSLAVAAMPALVEILNALSDSAGGMEAFTAKIKDSGDTVAAWAKFGIESFKMIAKAIAAPIQIAFDLGQAIGELANIAGNLLIGDFRGAWEASKRFGGELVDMKDRVMGVVDSFGSMLDASSNAWMVMETSSRDGSRAVVGATENVSDAMADMAASVGRSTSELRKFVMDMEKDTRISIDRFSRAPNELVYPAWATMPGEIESTLVHTGSVVRERMGEAAWFAESAARQLKNDTVARVGEMKDAIAGPGGLLTEFGGETGRRLQGIVDDVQGKWGAVKGVLNALDIDFSAWDGFKTYLSEKVFGPLKGEADALIDSVVNMGMGGRRGGSTAGGIGDAASGGAVAAGSVWGQIISGAISAAATVVMGALEIGAIRQGLQKVNEQLRYEGQWLHDWLRPQMEDLRAITLREVGLPLRNIEYLLKNGSGSMGSPSFAMAGAPSMSSAPSYAPMEININFTASGPVTSDNAALIGRELGAEVNRYLGQSEARYRRQGGASGI